jgi:multiple sugar transport system substrate-binding protein
MAVLGLVGCSQVTNTNATSNGQEPVTITYAMWQTNMTDYMQERIATFEAENPNIKVKLYAPDDYQTSSSVYWDKLDSADASEMPDVFAMNAPHFLPYQSAGRLLPVDGLISSSSTIDMAAFPESLSGIYKFDGKQYGIPIDYDTIGLWYNKELFDEAGLEYPNINWTWEDLSKAAEKLSALDGTYGILTSDAGQLGYYNTIAGCGGYVVRNGNDFGLKDPQTQAGMQAWVDLARYSPTLDEIEASGGPHMLFMKGKVGMVFGGDWEAADFTGADSVVSGSINVTMLPTMQNGSRASVIHGKANVISATTSHPAEAQKFLEFISSAESYEKLGETGLCIPAHSDYAASFFKRYPQYDMGIFAREAVDYSSPYPAALASDWEKVLGLQVDKMIRGQETVQEGCDQAASDLARR